jgi:hypothetical protein
VVLVQQRLARLRRFRARTSLMLGLPWWILWVPAAMVLAAMVGVDLYAASPLWVWSSIGVGVTGMAVCVAIARHLARRPERLSRFLDLHSGRSLTHAARELDELDQYGQEA